MIFKIASYDPFNAFLANPVEPTGCGTATLIIQNIAETENINAEMMLFTSKLKARHLHRMHIYCIF